MRASSSTLWMAAEAMDAQTQLDDKVRALNLFESSGKQTRQAAQKLVRHGARPEDIALSFNVEPAGSIKLKYTYLGRCNSKNKLGLMNGSLTKVAKN